MTAVPLVNRDGERDVITRLLEALHDGGGALVVHGEAGVGKSALLAWAADTAADRGMLVLTAAGVQSEMHLPFAALHQLLHPVLPRAENLPPPQRDAIRAAFAMSDAAVPDLFLVGLATLELLSEVADGSPVVVIADDAQWVDRSSADVLAFVARRVHRDPMHATGLRRNIEGDCRRRRSWWRRQSPTSRPGSDAVQRRASRRAR